MTQAATLGSPVEAERLSTFPAVSDGVAMANLVGTPHLFGKLKMLRRGHLIQPIGVLTLQPDGRLTGYAHPNEGSWIPYAHGEVDADKAFAFLTANNTWIPSSTWTQSMGDMPVGFFCDEPEMTQAMDRLCLVPHRVNTDPNAVVYLVASCLKFYEKTVPPILEQLFQEGIEPERIKVVVNGCEANSDRTLGGVDYAFTVHNGWEWSTLYEAPLRWNFRYGFLIHDTSVVFPGFRRRVESFNDAMEWDQLPASPLARCLLGLYSHGFLMRCNAWLKGTDGISKRDGVRAEVGAELLLRARSALVIGDPEYAGGARGPEWREIVDYYNTGTPRIRRVFPSIRVHKFIHSGSSSETSL
ncbi:MAG: hypothetical protein ACRYHB_06565 [Janthinobacterium lividum]